MSPSQPPRVVGGRTQLRREVDLNNPRSVIRPYSCADDHGTVMTISMQTANRVFTNTPPFIGEVIGFVNWGVGGALFTAEIDIHEGTQISIVATSVSLSAALLADLDNGEANEIESVDVIGSITIGTRAPRAQVNRSYGQRIVPNGASYNIPVPPFAFAFYLFSLNNDVFLPGGSTIRMFGGPYGTTPIGLIDPPTLLAGQNSEGFRLPEQCRTIQITNTSGDNAAIIPMYNLNL